MVDSYLLVGTYGMKQERKASNVVWVGLWIVTSVKAWWNVCAFKSHTHMPPIHINNVPIPEKHDLLGRLHSCGLNSKQCTPEKRQKESAYALNLDLTPSPDQTNFLPNPTPLAHLLRVKVASSLHGLEPE